MTESGQAYGGVGSSGFDETGGKQRIWVDKKDGGREGSGGDGIVRVEVVWCRGVGGKEE